MLKRQDKEVLKKNIQKKKMKLELRKGFKYREKNYDKVVILSY